MTCLEDLNLTFFEGKERTNRDINRIIEETKPLKAKSKFIHKSLRTGMKTSTNMCRTTDRTHKKKKKKQIYFTEAKQENI